ncbi:Heat shock protein hsp98, partial [Ascosphaera atra]
MVPVHLAVALLTPKEGESLFKQAIEKANGDTKQFERFLQRQLVRLPSQDPAPQQIAFSQSLARVLQAAYTLSQNQKDSFVAVDHLILALAQDRTIKQAFEEAGVNRSSLDSAVQQLRGEGKRDTATSDKQGVEGENLNKLCIDMTEMAREGKIDPVIGREDEIRRTIRILSRRTKNNPVLIGEPGVGKTTIVEGLARRIVNNDVPANLHDVKLLSLDVGALVAGTSYRGEFEQRMKGLLDEIAQSQQMIVLFIDEMHLLMGAGAGGQGGMDAANLLKPMLARGQLHCIGATTLAEYRKFVEKDAAFERRFQQVMVEEPSVDETISILRGLKEKYEVHHGVTITDGAIVASAQLASRYLTARRLPDSAVDLVDEAAAAVHVARESQPEELDVLERKLRQLQIEIHALEREKEDDEASATRLKEAHEEAANIKEELRPLRERWDREKKRSSEIQDAKIKLDQLKTKRDEAERRGDTATASDLIYYAIPDVEKRIQRLEAEKKKAEEEAREGPEDSQPLLTDAVRAEQINEIVSRMTGVPVNKLKGNEKDRLLQMEKHLSSVVVGQKEACRAVANAIRLQRSGLANPNRPPSFLFCGPSGTGKTLLTKALAEFLFDDANAMIRFDMSEYHDKFTVSRLVGAPPGYVGHDEGGQLTERLRRRPFSILLFDEIEKADKGVLTILLQLMDDGRITDSQGRQVDGKNCI